MLLNHCEKSHEEFQNFGEGLKEESYKKRQCKILSLMWSLFKVLLRHGNQEVYYNICGSIGNNSWDCPMEAEGLSIRMTPCGKKLTLW